MLFSKAYSNASARTQKTDKPVNIKEIALNEKIQRFSCFDGKDFR